MCWKAPTLPVTPADKTWVEESFTWFLAAFPHVDVRKMPLLLPSPEFFPDPYHGTPACARTLLDRVCGYMQVDTGAVDLDIYDDHHKTMEQVLPVLAAPTINSPAGLYVAPETSEERHLIGIELQQLTDPFSLVATLAHEVSHILLIGEGRIERTPHNELLTDLCTVFHGFGLFSANSARMFRQHQGGGYHGWSYARHGYLSEQVCGYALACWALLRGEAKPPWAGLLTTNVKADFQASRRYLQRTGDTTLTALAE